jgi:hypothetical protein
MKVEKIKNVSILGLLIIIVAISFAWRLSYMRISNNQSSLKKNVKELEQKIHIHQLLSEATFSYISKGNMENLLFDLIRIREIDSLEVFSIIDGAIEGLKNQIDSFYVDSENNEATQQQIIASKQRIRSLEEQISAIQQDKDFNFKNNQKQFDSLNQIIASQKVELNRKQRVRVISFKTEKGTLVHYLGEVQNDKANGNGVGIWSTGSIYRGQWIDNKRHGEGEFSWADGDVYKGEFIEGKVEGNGTYTWKSGERYEGEFVNGRRNGFGKLYDPDGNISFEGTWKNDKPLQKN